MISSRLVDAGGPASGMEPSEATRIAPALLSLQRVLNGCEHFASRTFVAHSCSRSIAFLDRSSTVFGTMGDMRGKDVRNARVLVHALHRSPLIRVTLSAYVHDFDVHTALFRAALYHQFDGGGEFQLLKNFGHIGKPLNVSAADADHDVAKSSRG